MPFSRGACWKTQTQARPHVHLTPSFGHPHCGSQATARWVPRAVAEERRMASQAMKEEARDFARGAAPALGELPTVAKRVWEDLL